MYARPSDALEVAKRPKRLNYPGRKRRDRPAESCSPTYEYSWSEDGRVHAGLLWLGETHEEASNGLRPDEGEDGLAGVGEEGREA